MGLWPIGDRVGAAVMTPHFAKHRRASGLRAPASMSLLALLLAACDGSGGGSPATTDATVTDAIDATTFDRAESSAGDAATPVDHTEPAPGTPGGRCSDGGACPANTMCNGARCEWCGGLGQVPCMTGCREGAPRWGVCFDAATPSGRLGGLCHLEDCDNATCTAPDGLAFVCFACGDAAGQPCCPVVGCSGPGLRCDDGVCH